MKDVGTSPIPSRDMIVLVEVFLASCKERDKGKRGYFVVAQPVIHGKVVDFITGRSIDDTEDERYRQKLAKFLVEEKGFLKKDIQVQRELLLTVDEQTWVVKIDFAVILEGKVVMILRFAPGSIVSRERPALAAARLLEAYAVPFAVVSNGQDAHILDTASSEVIGQSLEEIPSRAAMVSRFPQLQFNHVAEERLEKERRILFMFEAIATCPAP
jgi:hypothetical protein